MNLIEALQQEINRAKEILSQYEAIPTGAFGATMIRNDIKIAEKSIVEMDTIQMVISLKSLKTIQ